MYNILNNELTVTGWKGVYYILTKEGHTVSVVQNPTVSPRKTRSSPAVRSMHGWQDRVGQARHCPRN